MDNDELLIAISDMFEKKVEEVKLHTGVLVEDLRKDVKAIAEGHTVLLNKMDKLESKVDGIERKVDGLEKNMTVIKDYVIGVDAKLNEQEATLKRVK